ncbi:hypothetical protein [Cupriavidus metallidurans]
MPLIPIAMALGNFVPAIVRLLTGSDKAEEVAGKVVDIAKVVTGADDGQAALDIIKADPNKLLEFKQAFGAQQADIEKAYLADIADARARDVEVRKITGGHNFRADILALLAIGGLVACVWFIARDTTLPERAVNAIMFVAGQLSNAVMMVYAFEFGSSRGSKDKDSAISNLTRR